MLTKSLVSSRKRTRKQRKDAVVIEHRKSNKAASNMLSNSPAAPIVLSSNKTLDKLSASVSF
jgi:hypothetical protein